MSACKLRMRAPTHVMPRRAQMAEVARVLRPGGVFVGTTVMKVGAGLGEVLGDDVVRPLANVRRRPCRCVPVKACSAAGFCRTVCLNAYTVTKSFSYLSRFPVRSYLDIRPRPAACC